MNAEPLAIPEVILLAPPRHQDARGFLSVTWNRAREAALGVAADFVQDNHSVSAARFTVRGLHCQIAPSPQGKLVRVVRGAVWDVAVDIRRGSASFGRHVGAELSAANWRQLWVPPGFLHGFVTLEPDSEVIYKVTADYDPAAERGVLWSDPDLAIPWPVAAAAATLSDRDRALPLLAGCAGWLPG